MKIRPVGAELFRSGLQTGGHDEFNRRFLRLWKRSEKNDFSGPTKEDPLCTLSAYCYRLYNLLIY
jgi:hypothetical protein